MRVYARPLLVVAFFCLSAFAANFATAEEPFDVERPLAVDQLARIIEENFFDQERADEIGSRLRAMEQAGEFDDAASPGDLAQALTMLLRPEDTHFLVTYIGAEAAAEYLASSGGDELYVPTQEELTEVIMNNYGFRQVRILPGNVGYIDISGFDELEPGLRAAEASFGFVGEADAVMIDLRNSVGGYPSMVTYIIANFTDPMRGISIMEYVSEEGEAIDVLQDVRDIAQPTPREDVPLFILTSSTTRSAGEALSYDLQVLNRAVIVGEATVGAANGGEYFIGDIGYRIFVSTNATTNPITGTSWEGVGVTPDVELDAEMAFDQALLLSYEAILSNTDDETRTKVVSFVAEPVRYRVAPTTLDLAVKEQYVGGYGPRNAFLEGNQLTYQRDGNDPVLLFPLGDDRFLFGADEDYRVVFNRDETGQVISLSIQEMGGGLSTSIRDE